MLSAAPMSVPSEEEYFTKYASGILLTTSSSEPHTDLPQIPSEDSVNGVSHIPREIYSYVEGDTTSSIYCVGLEGIIHSKLNS